MNLNDLRDKNKRLAEMSAFVLQIVTEFLNMCLMYGSMWRFVRN